MPVWMKRMILIVSILVFFCFPFKVVAQEALNSSPQEETLEAKVIESIKEDVVVQDGQQFLYQKLKILVTKGSLNGQEVEVEVGNVPLVGQTKYQPGDQVLVTYGHNFEGNQYFYITDFIRRKSLAWLFVIFIVLAVMIGRWRGASSLLGMGLSFLVILKYILPKIYEGQDPILIAIVGSAMIIPLTFYLSHGFNKKTTVALIGTFVALVVTGLLAKTFMDASRLTGFVSEEAGFLQVAKRGSMDIKGLLLAGIIIGALGVLDDITVSQAAIVQQLKEAGSKLSSKELFSRAMNVGQDHIASMVNTLVLVYTGAALPLLLLFIDSPRPFSEVINSEIIAEEVIRTLVGSIGLITAVPITTILAIKLISRNKNKGTQNFR